MVIGYTGKIRDKPERLRGTGEVVLKPSDKKLLI